MTTENLLGPLPAHGGSTTRPAEVEPDAAAADTFWQDCVGGVAGTGTQPRAQWFNRIQQQIRRAIRGMGVPEVPSDDDMLLKAIQAAIQTTIPAGPFDCRLVKSGSNLVLQRHNGYRITTHLGTTLPIPSAGASLAPAGLTPGTFYYIYAYNSGGNVAIEASTTAPTVHSSGIKVATGDASRILVGAALVDTGPTFKDESGKLFVLSYFNRKRKVSRSRFSVTRSTSSSSYVELNSEIRQQFILWGDELVTAHMMATPKTDNDDHDAHAGIQWNATTGVSESINETTAVDSRTVFIAQTDWRMAGVLIEASLQYATVVGKTNDVVRFETETSLMIEING